jgi:hypothetical protein
MSSPRLTLKDDFDEAFVAVEEEDHFLPFVGGEAARIERFAVAAKRCLGVAASTPLDPWATATSVGVDVQTRFDFDELSLADQATLKAGASDWSAGTILGAGRARVILNGRHDVVRQKVTLAEELAHIVLGHAPSSIDSLTGLRTYDAEVEEEAYAVGVAMVAPYSHVFWLVKRKAQLAVITERFAISEQCANYRINRCGLRPMYRKASSG